MQNHPNEDFILIPNVINIIKLVTAEASTGGVLRIFAKFTEKLLRQSFFKKKTLPQVFSCELCEISKNTFFTELLWTTASVTVNPATSATAQRTFSLARNLKTWLRCTILRARFNSLVLLKFHKDRIDNLNLLNVASEFVSKET